MLPFSDYFTGQLASMEATPVPRRLLCGLLHDLGSFPHSGPSKQAFCSPHICQSSLGALSEASAWALWARLATDVGHWASTQWL